MALVLGVDSSTQSTKALLVDADDGTVVGQQSAPHPAGTEVDPRAWLTAIDTAGAGLLERADARRRRGTAARPGRPRRRRRTRPRRAPLERHPLGPAGRGADPGAGRPAGLRRRAGQRAGRLVHGHQAPLAPRPRARPGGAGGPGAAPARLRRSPPVGSGHRGVHRPRRRVRHRLLRDQRGQLATRPGRGRARSRARTATASSLPATSRRTPQPGSPSAPAPATTWRPRSGSDLQPGDVLISIGTSGVASTVSRAPIADGTGVVTGFADATGGFLPMVTTMNAAGILDLQAALARRRPRRARRAGPAGAARRRRGDPAALLRRRAHAQPARRRRHLDRPDLRAPPAPTSPGRRSRRCCARSPTRSTPCRATGEAARPGPARGRRRPQPRRARPGPADPRPRRRPARRWRVRRPRRRAPGRLGALGCRQPPDWPLPTTETLDAEPTPTVRERYAALRDHPAPPTYAATTERHQ